VAFATVPRKRTDSPVIREVEEWGSVGRDRVDGSLKRNEWQKKAAGYFDDLDGEVAVVPRKGSKGKGKAAPESKGRTTPQPKEVMDDGE
jgi:hypothetical protein